MVNKLAPYRDKEIIEDLIKFYKTSNVRSVMTSYSPFSREFDAEVYREYIRWQHDEKGLPVERTLNQPQFDKAFGQAIILAQD